MIAYTLIRLTNKYYIYHIYTTVNFQDIEYVPKKIRWGQLMQIWLHIHFQDEYVHITYIIYTTVNFRDIKYVQWSWCLYIYECI